MRSNQLSYLAIVLKASAKVEHFFKLAKYFVTFFNFYSKFLKKSDFRPPESGFGAYLLLRVG